MKIVTYVAREKKFVKIMTYALVELAVTSPAHGGVVSSVNFCDLVPLDVLDLVHRHVPGKRNSLVGRKRTF